MYIESICYKRPQFNDQGTIREAFSINLTNLNPHLNVIVGKNDTNKEILSQAMWRLRRIFLGDIDAPSSYYEIVFVESCTKQEKLVNQDNVVTMEILTRYQYILSIEARVVIYENLTCLNDNRIVFERGLDGLIKSKDIKFENNLHRLDVNTTFIECVDDFEYQEDFKEAIAIFKFVEQIAYQEFFTIGSQTYFDYEIKSLRESFGKFPNSFLLSSPFAYKGSLNSCLGFVLFLLYFYSLKRKENKLPLVWLDSVGCGLDFEEKRRIGHLIYEQYAVNNQTTQLFMTTHEREILNAIPIEYWQILEKSEQGIQVYNQQTAAEAFTDFAMIGLSHFDLFSGQMYKETKEE